jgi:hypothetical protein
VLSFELESSLVCVGVLRIWVLCVLLFPTLLCAFFMISIVRARGSKLWRFITNGKTLERKRLWYSSWSSDHLKGVECNPRPLGRHNMEVGKCYLAEPRDKIAFLLWLLSLWLFCPQELASKLLSRTDTSITKFCGYLVFNFTGSPIQPPSRCSH